MARGARHGGRVRGPRQPPQPLARRRPRLQGDEELLDVGLGEEGGSSDEIVEVRLGEERPEHAEGRQAEPSVSERRLEPRKLAEDLHGARPPPGSALAEVQRLHAVGPEGAVARLEVGVPRVELGEVEEEVGLEVPLGATQLGQPPREGGGGERGGRGRREVRGHGDLR
jgi:hypothetical protein